MSKNRSVKFEKVRQVRVVFENGEMRLPVKIRHAIQKHWELLISSGKKYWNGSLFCLKRIDRSMNEHPVLFVEETTFAHYLATAYGKIPPQYACRVVFVSILFRTSDDFFVLGEMADHTVSPEMVQCAGGGLERKYLLPDSSFDVRGNASGELKEELYFDAEDPDEIETFRPRFLKTGGDGNVGVFFKVKTPLSHTELFGQYIRRRNRERSRGNTPEFHGIVCVPETYAGVRKFLKTDWRPRVDYLEPLLEMLVSKER